MVGDGRFKENSQMYWYPSNIPFFSFHSVKLPERAAFTWPSFPHFSSTPQTSAIQLPLLLFR